jgi:hypothetical protein
VGFLGAGFTRPDDHAFQVQDLRCHWQNTGFLLRIDVFRSQNEKRQYEEENPW